MEFFGKSPIAKRDYLIAKSTFFSICFIIVFQFFGVDIRQIENDIVMNISGLVVVFGILLILAGIANMRSSIRMGLPRKKTKFRSDGLYRISRNPIYVGFILVEVGGVFYTANIVVLIFAIIAIFYHHKIILSEEKFLEKEFGKEYLRYKSRVRRYL